MNSGFIIEVKTIGWSISFQPYHFLNKITIGDSTCEVVVPGCKAGIVLSVSIDTESLCFDVVGGLLKESKATTYQSDITSEPHLHVVETDHQEAAFSVAIHYIVKRKTITCDRCLSVPENKKIVIGFGRDVDIQIEHSLVKERLFSLIRKNDLWIIEPIEKTPLGLYVNTEKIDKSKQCSVGDFIFAPGLHMFLSQEGIYLSSQDNIRSRTLQYIDNSKAKNNQHYPCLNRTTRYLPGIPNNTIEIQSPPKAPDKNKNNIIISLLPTIAMIILTVLLRGSYASNSQMILFSVLSMMIGAVSSIITYVQTNKEASKGEEKRNTEYKKYIGNCEDKIIAERSNEKRILHEIYVDPSTELKNIDEFSASLFDRQMEDNDFLDIRMGYGRVRSGQEIKFKKQEVFEATDELFALPELLQKKYMYIDDVPVYIHGRTINALGVVGNVLDLKQLFTYLVLDIVSRHYYDDVQLHCLLTEQFYDELHAIRLFPHVKNGESLQRNIVCSDESRSRVLADLFKILSQREAQDKVADNEPWQVVFIDANDSASMRHPLIKFVTKASDLHTLFVFVATQRDRLPQGCGTIVRMMNNETMGVITNMQNDDYEKIFEYQPIDNKEIEYAAIRLAPVYSGEVSLANDLTGNESLYNMLGIYNASEMNILENWNRANTTQSMAVPVGIQDDGSVLCLDLHENMHGPHGLVAGMTGSGKTQVIVSYLLSLAANYSPEDVVFAVIDFKGGDIVKQLPNLPHIVGSITNLNKSEINRSMRLINAEKNRRMVLFDEEHANVSNIFEYTKAYHERKVTTPLPHLLIIVDEFAELKSQYPDFMQDLISIARVGRSLGIHLILCTQKPAGIVDGQIWSNSNFHLCLKVQNAEDSNEVLHSPLAAEIREPGRGYLQVEQKVFSLFQSGYSGYPEKAQQEEKGYTIHQLDLSGEARQLYKYAPAEVPDNTKTQREAVLQAVCDAFSCSGIKKPKQLCLPSLPEILPYTFVEQSEQFNVAVGLLDDPDNQNIDVLSLDLVGKNTLIIGGSQTGKTNLLLTIIRSICDKLTSEDIAVYALDFNAKAIKTLEAISLIGGVIVDDEEEKLKSLIKLLRVEIIRRKALFAQKRVNSFVSYRQISKDLSAIIVLIDNYAVFKELYEEAYGDDFLYLMREGNAYGISFIVTAQQLSALSYKKPYYFTQRIVLPLSEQAEYSAVLDGCRITLPEIPGRVLIKKNKKIYEGHLYEAFSGKNEAARIIDMNEFIEKNSIGKKAPMIPQVPDVLTLKYIQDNYSDHFSSAVYPYAISYDDIEPISLDMNRSRTMALIGGDEANRNKLLQHFIKRIAVGKEHINCRLNIFDSYLRPLKEFRGYPGVNLYNGTIDDFDAILDQLCEQIDSYESDDESENNVERTVIVMNSYELIRKISDDSMIMDKFTKVIEDWQKLKVFFLFADIPNKTVSFSSPDLLKFIAEEKQGLILSDLKSVRFYDIPLSTIREQTRPLDHAEAFVIQEDDIIRVKYCN